MAVLDYLNFDLEITAVGDGYRTRVLDSPVGEVEGTFVVPFTEETLEIFVLRVGRTRVGVRRVGSPQQRAAEAFGTQLFDALLNGELRSTFGRSMDAADNAGMGLRIRLRLSDAPALADIPWEYMYWSGQRRFLVLSTYTPLVRYIDLPRRIRPLTVTAPLRVLLVVAGPRDLPALDVEREEANTRHALQPLVEAGLVEVVTLPTATLPQLRRTLRSGDFHVLHFVGHGGYDESLDGGVLAFENESGYRELVSGDVLATLLCDHPTLRLALLNACEGARSSRTDPFAGVAQALVCQGIPAVIGMQFEFTDKAALAFSSEFYLALLDGYPVDAALAEARRAVLSGDNDVEWGTPVLYLRSQDGRIFDVRQRPTAEAKALVHETDHAALAPEPAVVVEPLEAAEVAPESPPVSEPVGPAVPMADAQRTSVPPAAAPPGPPPTPGKGGQWWREKRTILVAALVAAVLIAGTIVTVSLNSDKQFVSISGPIAASWPASSSTGGDSATSGGSSSGSAVLTASRGTPVVDGTNSEWGEVPILAASSVVGGSGDCAGGGGRWQLMWDSAGLYFLVYNGYDPKPWTGDPARIYNGDSVGFQLGQDARSLAESDGMRDGDHSFQFGVGPDGAPLNVVVGPDQTIGNNTGVVSAQAGSGVSHLVEGFVPWSFPGVNAETTAAAGALLAANFNITNGPGADGLTQCAFSTNPNLTLEGTTKPRTWQTLRLLT